VDQGELVITDRAMRLDYLTIRDGSQLPQLHVRKTIGSQRDNELLYYPFKSYFEYLWKNAQPWDFKIKDITMGKRDRFPQASAHGRFQPFHNGHLEYILAAKERCDFLWIGITKFEIFTTTPLGRQRERPENNSLTYFE
jgi:cytidyltransferase-like protein